MPRLIIGTGVDGKLPVRPEVKAEAEQRGVDLLILPTARAIDSRHRRVPPRPARDHERYLAHHLLRRRIAAGEFYLSRSSRSIAHVESSRARKLHPIDTSRTSEIPLLRVCSISTAR